MNTTENTTIENNKLIAEFLGLETIVGTSIVSVVQHNQLKVFNPNNNWNWLMECVEKIESYHDVVFVIHSDFIKVILKFTGETIFSKIIDTSKKEAVYNACVEFIKWHNLQNS